MRGKKAWLRIVEAVIAVLILASVMIVMISREPRRSSAETIQETQRQILTQVSLNETFRGEILQNKKENADIFINRVLPPYWSFVTRICEVDEVCGMPFYLDKEIYADEILVAANLTRYSPKKLKLFVWIE